VSTERISSTRAGFVDDSKRQPCRWCGKLPEGKRRTFCSDACVHEHKLRTDPQYQARHVLERDHGVCAICGRDCVSERERLREFRARVRRDRFGERARWLPDHWVGDRESAYADECERIGLPVHLRSLCRRLWEMDHVVPVVEGGGDCGLENLRTLCWACHRAETAALAARRAQARRQAAREESPQQQIPGVET